MEINELNDSSSSTEKCSEVTLTDSSSKVVPLRTDGDIHVAQNSKNPADEPSGIGHEVSYVIDKVGETVFSSANGSVVETVKTNEHLGDDNACEAIIKIPGPLCADYRSDSDRDSFDSESDSSTPTGSSTDTSSDSDTESEEDDTDDSGTANSKKGCSKKKPKTDLSLSDLPQIEELKISVPEDACIEIGTITSIVDTLVVVESYKGTAALDVDTVLFLDRGKRSLGKVFDILGPVSEPVYAVRFNSPDEIKNYNVEKGMKVFCAPTTQHTSFVFLSEVMKIKGSDASWKDNTEAPSEFLDFSDDEEERLYKKKIENAGNCENEGHGQSTSRKRPFNTSRAVVRPSRFRSPDTPQPRRTAPSRIPPNPQFRPPHINPYPPQTPPFPYNAPVYPAACMTNGLPPVPRTFYPPRFSGPPFPTFGALPYLAPGQHFQQPFYQQRTHAPPQPYCAWSRPMFRQPPPPPPPPPPPITQGE